MYSWFTLLWHQCYYPHRSRDSMSPVCGIFFFRTFTCALDKFNKWKSQQKKSWGPLLTLNWHILTDHIKYLTYVLWNRSLILLEWFSSLGQFFFVTVRHIFHKIWILMVYSQLVFINEGSPEVLMILLQDFYSLNPGRRMTLKNVTIFLWWDQYFTQNKYW